MADHLDVVVRVVEKLEPMLESAKTGDWKNVEVCSAEHLVFVPDHN
jgi:hypothetical protein